MYIDPGTGSIIIQVLIGLALSIPFLIKLYWAKLKNLFKGKKNGSENE